MVYGFFRRGGQDIVSETSQDQSEKERIIKPAEKSKKNSDSAKDEIIIYHGDGCPRCLNVEKFVEETKIEQKISIEWKEIYKNKSNAKDYVEKAGKCGLSRNQMVVPFLWDGKTCLTGDEPIINFLKQKI